MEPNIPAIVGEQVAGQASKVLTQISAIIKDTNTRTFDLGELLHEAKKNQYFLTLGFDTFGAYGKSLDLKITKLYYLTKIAENMEGAGVSRAEYEPVGTAKLRLISKLDLFDKEGHNVMVGDLTMAECVKELTSKAKDMDPEEVQQVVEKLQGKTGDDAMVWLNVSITKAAREVVRKALELIKLNIGTVGQDEDGKHLDSSDGRALELMAAEYLSDPSNGAAEIASVGPEYASTEGWARRHDF